jgi:CHAD domain-containing protein
VKRALAVLRELVQVAGRGRELDVCLELLKARLGALGPSSPERRLLRGRLAGAVRRSRKHLADAVLDLEIARLRRDLRFVAKGGSADALAVFARLRETWDGLGGAVVEGFGALGNRFDPEALHRLRRQARRLRYAAEVSRALTGHDSDAAAAFKDLQERLGAINDNYVLGDWLSKGAARARARGAAALAAEASSLAAWFDAQSRGHHRALLVRGPLQVATRALATMGRAPAESMRERTLARRRSRQEGPEHSASV